MVRSKRVFEFLTVLAIVAFIAWNQRPTKEAVEASLPTPPTTTQTSATPLPESSGSINIHGYFLGDRSPAHPTGESTKLELDEENRVFTIRGRQLSKGNKLLFQTGASHDEVKAALGKPNAFAHGGLAWGYWSVKEGQERNPGLLIKFSPTGVHEVVLSQDWIPLSTELATMTIDGPSDPVDGSDGYKDLRDWAEQGKQR